MRSNARILGIETSCDETAAAIVDAAGTVHSSIISSQLDIHRVYGGVVPELASREHLRNIVPVVRQALNGAGSAYADVAAVAVTVGPGLAGALLVGITYAKGVAFAAGIPLIGVNHLDGHIHAVLLDAITRIEDDRISRTRPDRKWRAHAPLSGRKKARSIGICAIDCWRVQGRRNRGGL